MARIPPIQRRWLTALQQHPLRHDTFTSHAAHSRRHSSLRNVYSDSTLWSSSSHIPSPHLPIHRRATPKTVRRILLLLPTGTVRLLSTSAAATPIAHDSSTDHTSSSSSSSSSSRSSSRRRLLSRELLWSVFLVVQFTSFMYVVRHYLFDIMSCVGPSMLPTMNASGDLVLISCHRRYAYQRGDVVVAHSITNPRHKVCKRIIAVAHDTITPPHSAQSVTVPAGHVWLQGDNLANSSDSRVYGPVPLAMVVGRVEAKLWPVSELGWVDRTLRYSGLEGGGGEGQGGGSGGRRRHRPADAEVVQGEGASILHGARGRLSTAGGVAVLAESSWQVSDCAVLADDARGANNETPAPPTSKSGPNVVLIPFTTASVKRTPAAPPSPPVTQ